MNMKKFYILYILIIVLLGINLQAKSKIKLEQGEKRFKSMKSYTLHDFNFNWHITYMDIVNYDVYIEDNENFRLPPKMKFNTIAKMGKTVKFF